MLSAMHEHQLIGEYGNEYWLSEPWAERLTKWCSILGLTQVPDELEEQFLVEALANDFKGHSFAEIEVALKMCVMDEFPQPIEAYNKLNLRFLAKLMNAYRVFRKEVANKYEEVKFDLQKPVDPGPPTPFSLDMAVCAGIWEDYVRYSNDVEIYPASYKAELLQKLGILSSEETANIATRIGADVIEQHKTEVRTQELRRLDALVRDQERLRIHADRLAKERVYLQWLNGLKAAQTTFEQFCDCVESKVFSIYGETKIVDV